MRVRVRNLMGLEHFEADIQPGVTFVCGANASGKSSLAVAIGALTARVANPLHLPTGEVKSYITIGQTEGVATLGENDTGIQWYGNSMSDGDPDGAEEMPLAIPHAVGMVDFLSPKRTKNDRARVWEDLFLPPSPQELLEPKWPFSTKELDSCIAMISDPSGGWDKAHSNYEGQRRHAKQMWGKITGERYGKSKVNTWVPTNWREELADASEETLQAAIADANDVKQRLIAVQAVSSDEVQRARHIRDEVLPAKRMEMKAIHEDQQEFEGDLLRLTSAFSSVKGALADLEREHKRTVALLNAKPHHKCPECDVGLEVSDGGNLTRWRAPTNEDIQNAMNRKEEIAGEHASLMKDASAHQEGHKNLTAQKAGLMVKFSTAQAEVNSLRAQTEAADRVAQDAVDPEQVADAQNRIDRSNHDKIAWCMKRDADIAAQNVAHFDDVIDLLGPTGVRGGTMQTKMAQIRDIMHMLCSAAGWTEVLVQREYDIVIGGVPMRMASRSERLRAQWLCQLACAYLSRSEWVVLDEADLLDLDNWDGMTRMLDAFARQVPHLRVVVCATGVPEDVPAHWVKVEL